MRPFRREVSLDFGSQGALRDVAVIDPGKLILAHCGPVWMNVARTGAILITRRNNNEFARHLLADRFPFRRLRVLIIDRLQSARDRALSTLRGHVERTRLVV